MTSPSTNNRPRHPLFVAVIAVIAMFASACGLTRDVTQDAAATITLSDGTEVSVTAVEIDEALAALQNDIPLRDAAFGPPDGTPEAEDQLRREILDVVILNKVSASELERLGGEVASASLEAERTSFLAQIASVDPVGGEGAAIERLTSQPYLGTLLELRSQQVAISELMAETLPPVEAVLVPCASHILLESEDEAVAVKELADAGEDFAQLAIERSTGPSGPNGGDLGCADPANYVTEFADALRTAEEGVPVGPVQTQFGWHVILVTGFQEQPGQGPDPRAMADDQLFAALDQATVVIDPSIGEWDAQGRRVVGSGAPTP